MGQTTFSGPIRAGTVREGSSANVGNVILAQQTTIGFAQADGVNTGTGIILPAGFSIVDITVDVTTVWNSSVSDALEIGDSTDADEYGDVADLQTLGRVVIDPDGPQAAVWTNSGSSDVEITTTVNQSGTAATTGVAVLTVRYMQN